MDNKPELILKNGTVIKDDLPTFIIAEIGQNHQGDIDIAKQLILKAKECGANCVKFQKSCLDEKFTRDALNAPYTSPNSWGKTYGEHKAFLEFSKDEYQELQKYANQIGISFTASAMDIESLKFLNSLAVPFIKIGSGDSTNVLLLEEAAKLACPLIISTGMCTMEDVDTIFKTISKEHKNFALLQCVSSYPTQPEDCNLGIIHQFKSRFPIIIGYSGHEIGFIPTIGAVALGAKIVERHITLNKSWKGSDHVCSLDIEEFKNMVEAIRETENALGVEKKLLPCEEECWKKLGKSIVAAHDISKGLTIRQHNLKIKVSKPPGIAAQMLKSVIGRTAVINIQADKPIFESHLSEP